MQLGLLRGREGTGAITAIHTPPSSRPPLTWKVRRERLLRAFVRSSCATACAHVFKANMWSIKGYEGGGKRSRRTTVEAIAVSF